eukprot:scaffold99427_cov17-Prasinocladus_malaysianus.AAC.1
MTGILKTCASGKASRPCEVQGHGSEAVERCMSDYNEIQTPQLALGSPKGNQTLHGPFIPPVA